MGAVGAAIGFGSLISSMLGKKNKPPAPVAPPPAPTVANAEADAKAQQLKKRRISMLSGGQTDLTAGSAGGAGATVGSKTLLGG